MEIFDVSENGGKTSTSGVTKMVWLSFGYPANWRFPQIQFNQFSSIKSGLVVFRPTPLKNDGVSESQIGS